VACDADCTEDGVHRRDVVAARSVGATIARLQARRRAQPIYERLGFTTVSRYRLFCL
jgi:hypothetical protein